MKNHGKVHVGVHSSSMTHCNRRGAAPRAPIPAKIGSLDAPENYPHFAAPPARVRARRAARSSMAQPCRCVGGAMLRPRAMHWGPRRGWRAVALGQTSRLGPEMGCALRAGSEAAGLGPRQAGRCPHGGGLVGQGRASGPGFLQRFTGATAGSRHSRPRDSQGAHVGALGGKMRTILRHI